MKVKTDVPIKVCKTIGIVGSELQKKLDEYRCRLIVRQAGYPVLTDWHPVIPEGWAEFPKLPFKRSVVYRGNTESWAYSHHHAITKFNDKYVVSWSNGFRHEDYVGQEVHYAWSKDVQNWSEPKVLVHTPLESKLVRNNAGLYATDERLYCYVGVAKDYGRDVAPPGMSTLRIKDGHVKLDVYETSDLQSWTHHQNICADVCLYEGPRKTKSGSLLCCGMDILYTQAKVLIWDAGADPTGQPRVVNIPVSADGVQPLEGTWYQTDDGRVWMYQRDESASCRLALSWSDDAGQTWSEMLRTDFPNSMSRAFVGRLNDGRYYIVGNNYDVMLDRRALQIALSDDGLKFDRQYTLVQGDTTRRVNGRHKEDGYHYPNCYVDGDKLLVTYSVNKEDIEVGSVDMSRVD